MAEKKTTAKTAPAPAVETVENPVNKMIDGLVEKAQAALKEFLTLDQEQIDHIVHEMALAGLDKHQELARMAVEETGRGVYEDKVIKNMFATEYIWHDIKKEKTVGVLDENEMEGYVEVAEPVGVIAGVTPTTNPTSTTLFKSLIAVKTRNPIIFCEGGPSLARSYHEELHPGAPLPALLQEVWQDRGHRPVLRGADHRVRAGAAPDRFRHYRPRHHRYRQPDHLLCAQAGRRVFGAAAH